MEAIFNRKIERENIANTLAKNFHFGCKNMGSFTFFVGS